jgi:hypothetical protein
MILAQWHTDGLMLQQHFAMRRFWSQQSELRRQRSTSATFMHAHAPEEPCRGSLPAVDIYSSFGHAALTWLWQSELARGINR